MRPIRRRVVLVATLREMEATLTDAAIAMFGALVGRAHLLARKRLEQRVAASGREGRERLARVASVLKAMTRAARSGANISLAVQAIAPLETIDADIIRRSASPHKSDVLEEIAAEYRTFKRVGPVFLRAFDCQGRTRTASLSEAMTAIAFHRLGRFRDRGLENQKTRAAALNLVTAAIILFNCRYLGRALDELRRQGKPIDPAMQAQLSPLGWDRINLTGDYVWSDHLDLGPTASCRSSTSPTVDPCPDNAHGPD